MKRQELKQHERLRSPALNLEWESFSLIHLLALTLTANQLMVKIGVYINHDEVLLPF